MNEILLKVYRFVFCRKFLYPINLHLYNLALRGIGVLNSGDPGVTGERYFLKNILSGKEIKIVFDVGASTGGYSKMIKQILPGAKIYAFEPNPDVYKILKKNLNGSGIKSFNTGLSDKKGTGLLWDFADDAELKISQPFSNFASNIKGVIEKLHGQKSKAIKVKLTTIDTFCENKKIEKINLLKIDTEGSELKVLQGARRMLKSDKIDMVLFEFNEMNAYARVFFMDLTDILNNFVFFRLSPEGMVNLANYRPKTHEIFAFQNIIAVNKSLIYLVK